MKIAMAAAVARDVDDGDGGGSGDAVVRLSLGGSTFTSTRATLSRRVRGFLVGLEDLGFLVCQCRGGEGRVKEKVRREEEDCFHNNVPCAKIVPARRQITEHFDALLAGYVLERKSTYSML